jgi:hypothetical protein
MRLIQKVFFVFLLSTDFLMAGTIVSRDVRGSWDSKESWVGGIVPSSSDDVVIVKGAIITVQGSVSMNNLTIESGGVLMDSGTGTIQVTGDVLVNGNWAGSASLVLSGQSKSISGTGVISNSSVLTMTGAKSIPAEANLVKTNGSITLNQNTTVVNNGSFAINGNLAGVNGTSSIWTNADNAVLTISGALLPTGVLNASAPNNTVNFAGVAAQNVKRPANGIFHHLVISGAINAPKSLITGNYTINGNLTIYSSLDANGRSITLMGDWINAGGTFTSSLATVALGGSVGQSITSKATESFYNLTIDNSAGITSNNNLSVTNTLTLTSGRLTMGNYLLTLGTSAMAGSLIRQGGMIEGKLERWLMSSQQSSTVLFPVSTSASYRPLSIQLSGVTTTGSLIVEFVNSPPGPLASPPLTDADGNKIYNTFNDGYWSLTSANSFAANAYSLSATLQDFTPLPNTAFNGIDDKTRLLMRSSSTANWSLAGKHVSYSAVNTCSRSGLTAMSAQFCLGDDTNCSSPGKTTISAPGGIDLCTASARQVYSVVSGKAGSTYTWSVPAGGTITSGQGTPSVSVDWGTNGGARSVSVVENNGCTYGVPASLQVNIHPLPLERITGKAVVLATSPVTENYSVPAWSGYSYAWNLTASAQVGAITQGATTPVAAVQWKGKGNALLQVNASYAGCQGATSSANLSVDVKDVIESISPSGNWSSPQVWSCRCVPGVNDRVTIQNGHTITLDQPAGTEVKHLSIGTGATLNTSSNSLTVYGDLLLHGTITGTGTLILAGSGTWDGTGSLTTVPVTISTSRTISATAWLSKTSSTGTFLVGAGATVTNNGFISLAGGLTAASTTSTWINEAQSTLRVGGALFSSPAGALQATASGNTVVYTGATANNVKVPVAGQYFHLAFSGTGASRLPAGAMIQVQGNFINDGLFVPSTSTVTFNGNSLISGSAISSFYHVNINAASTLAAPGTIQVAGDFTNNGTFVAKEGTVVFNGATTQTISGNAVSTFHNMMVNDNTQPTDVIMTSPQKLEGLLTLAAGAVVESKGNLTLLSTADNPAADASIGPLLGGSNVVGDVTVERYISAEPPTPRQGLYRYLSSPVMNATVSQWQQSFAITGNFDGASTSDPLTGSKTFCGGYTFKPGNTSLFTYNEVAQAYEAFPNRSKGTSSVSILTPGRGYAAYVAMKDCDTPVTLHLKGIINQASTTPFDFTPMITYTSSPKAVYAGYNLVGNPFPSAIDWGAPGGAWIKNNVSRVIAIRDNGSGPGRFVYIDETDPLISNRVIALGQAFWVRTTASSPSLKIAEQAKVSGVAHAFYRQANPGTDKLTITLISGNLQDEAYLKINPKAKPSLDDFDGPKMSNNFFDLSTLSSDNVPLAINAINESICGLTIPLHIVKSGSTVMENGRYSLSFLRSGFFCHGFTILLKDAYTGHVQDVSVDPGYSFTVSSASPGASAANRFSITFQEKPIPLDNPMDTSATACGENPAIVCVRNTSLNVSYFATLHGTTVSDTLAGPFTLRFFIPSRFLSSKVDTVYTMAQTVCSTYRLNHYALVKKDTEVYRASAGDVAQCGEGVFTLQASGSPYGYRWYDSLTAVRPVGAGATLVTPVLTESHAYYVAALNASGCEGERVRVNAQVSHRDPGIFAQSPGGYSCGEGMVTLEASSNLPSMNFYWYDSIDSSIPLFSGSTFVTPMLRKSRRFYVSAVNGKMCEGVRNPVQAIIVDIDPVGIQVSDDWRTLLSSSESGNQWYKDGQLIAGATAQKFVPTESGVYTVAVSRSGCQVVSAELPFLVTGIAENQVAEVKVYPNPGRDWITIRVRDRGPVRASICRITGQELDAFELGEEGSEQVARYNIASLSAGVYLLKLDTGGGPKFFKIIKE